MESFLRSKQDTARRFIGNQLRISRNPFFINMYVMSIFVQVFCNCECVSWVGGANINSSYYIRYSIVYRVWRRWLLCPGKNKKLVTAKLIHISYRKQLWQTIICKNDKHQVQGVYSEIGRTFFYLRHSLNRRHSVTL